MGKKGCLRVSAKPQNWRRKKRREERRTVLGKRGEIEASDKRARRGGRTKKGARHREREPTSSLSAVSANH